MEGDIITFVTKDEVKNTRICLAYVHLSIDVICIVTATFYTFPSLYWPKSWQYMKFRWIPDYKNWWGNMLHWFSSVLPGEFQEHTLYFVKGCGLHALYYEIFRGLQQSHPPHSGILLKKRLRPRDSNALHVTMNFISVSLVLQHTQLVCVVN
jgi:hypothetical protein